MNIKNIEAFEIIDSRGNPTLEAVVTLENGIKAKAAVPSGASTGENEALELRDGGERFFGKGVLTACQNVTEKIFPAIKELNVYDQKEIDQAMIDLDGTENKSQLGANAILAVSLAVCRGAAISKKMPLWQYINEIYSFTYPTNDKFPALMMNVINGGVHADSGLDIQEYMFVVDGFDNFSERVRAGAELYHDLKEYLKEHHFRIAVGDEGGFAPHLSSNEEPLEIMSQVLRSSKFAQQGKVTLGIDAAASEFFKDNSYQLRLEVAQLDTAEMIERYEEWINKYELTLIEDPLSQSDWGGWNSINKKIGKKIDLIGDDLLVTQKKFLQRAIDEESCNAILIKVNQVGSLSETIETIKLAQENKMKIAVSHRSGETTDDFIADLAIATGAELVKFGAPARGGRVVKYNRLNEIAREVNAQ